MTYKKSYGRDFTCQNNEGTCASDFICCRNMSTHCLFEISKFLLFVSNNLITFTEINYLRIIIKRSGEETDMFKRS